MHDETGVPPRSLRNKLRYERDFIDAVLQSAGSVILVIDRNGAIVRFNKAAEAFTGYSFMEVRGRPFFWKNFLLPDQREGVEEVFHSEFSEVKRTGHENFWVSRSGEKRLFRWDNAVIRDTDGPSHLIAIGTDITEIREAEIRIMESEKQLHEILNLSPIAVRIAVNGGRKVAFSNPRYCALIGNPQAAGEDPQKYYARESEYREVLAELANGNSIIDREMELSIPGSPPVWTLASYMPIPYQKEMAVLGWFYDITDLKSISLKLQQSESEYRRLIDFLPYGVLIHQGGKIVLANLAAAKHFGSVSPEKLHGTPVMERVHPEFIEIVRKRAEAALLGKNSGSMEEKLLRLDGSFFHAEVSALSVEFNGRPASLAVFGDITERKNLLEALRKENEKNLALLRNASDGIHILDPQGNVLEVSDSFCSMLGYSREEMIGANASQWYLEEDLEGGIRERLGRQERTQFETRHRLRNGKIIDVEVSALPLELDGRTVLFKSSRDITGRKRLEKSQATLARAYRLLSDAGDVIMRAQSETEMLSSICRLIVEVGGYVMAWVGIPQQDEGSTFRPIAQSGYEDGYLGSVVVSWADNEQGRGPTGKAFRTGKTQVNQNCLLNPEMAPWRNAALGIGYQASIALPILENGKPGSVLTIYSREASAFSEQEVLLLEHLTSNLCFGIQALRDFQVRRQAMETLRINAGVFESSQEGILITDSENRIVDVNPAFSSITGYSREEAIGKNPGMLESGLHSEEFFRGMWAAILKDGRWRGEIWNRNKSGKNYAALLSISVVKNEDGEVIRHVAVFSDISQIKRHEAELEQIAHYDPLTGIPNRMLLADRLKHAIAQANREQNLLAICYMDLDGFKPVNDKYGHETGDEVLIEIARRISKSIRGGDTVARLGGDEFVILQTGIEKGDECVASLERLLSRISEPILIRGAKLELGASIGVAIYPLDNEDPDTLLRHADQAMYIAKQSGKNRFQIYDPNLDQRIQVQLSFLRQVREGLEGGQFELHYQPKISLKTHELHGAEALIRWNHPERGFLLPGEFLGTVENTELDIKIGEWVIEQALKQMEEWRKSGLEIQVSVNISAYHLESRDFVRNLERAILTHPGLPPGSLQIELLETATLQDIALVNEIISSCRQFGVSFALDDFGTGYSSLSYLRKLYVDAIKIDRTFVRVMLDDPGDRAIVQSVISLAGTFGRHAIAEGVETEAHYRALLEMGCEYAQGFGIAQPMEAQKFLEWKDLRERDRSFLPPSGGCDSFA